MNIIRGREPRQKKNRSLSGVFFSELKLSIKKGVDNKHILFHIFFLLRTKEGSTVLEVQCSM